MQDVPEDRSDTGPAQGKATSPVRFARLVLDLAACALARESGEAIPLTRGEFRLLRLFVSRPGRVVSRDAILDAVANRPLELFDRSADALVGRLRRKIEPDPKAPRLIVTVPGEGYRFDGLAPTLPGAQADGAAEPSAADRAPELAEAAEPASPDSAPLPPSAASARLRLWRRAAAAAALAVLLFAAGAYGWRSGLAPRLFGGPAAEDKLASAPRLSIVVLPFENLSGDKQQDYFADGITDDLTTDLSHLADAFVISHGTALTFKDKPVDPKAIGRELGVRYLMEGSVRRHGDKVEVNAELVSTETGAQVWADRFEGERSKLGDLQAEFVSRLANSLGVELVKAEALRAMRERPNNPDATDLAMQGWATFYSRTGATWVDDSIALFERALALDPENVRAMTGLTYALVFRADRRKGPDPADTARAEKTIDAALALEPDNSLAHQLKSLVYYLKRQWGPAISEAETAVADDPNNAGAHAIATYWKMFVGRSEDGFAGVDTAFRLSPRDPFAWVWLHFLCHLHTHLAQWEQAIEACGQSVAANPQNWYSLVDLVAANAWSGRDKEARDAAAQLQKVYPGFTVQTWAGIHYTDDPTFNAQYARIVAGLRKAGLPEGEAKKE